MNDDRFAEIARALAHPARVHIINLLAQQTECRGADVFGELDLAQSTVSEHLRVLREAGLVSSRPEGTSALYCVVPNEIDAFAAAAADIARTSATCAGGCS